MAQQHHRDSIQQLARHGRAVALLGILPCLQAELQQAEQYVAAGCLGNAAAQRDRLDQAKSELLAYIHSH